MVAGLSSPTFLKAKPRPRGLMDLPVPARRKRPDGLSIPEQVRRRGGML